MNLKFFKLKFLYFGFDLKLIKSISYLFEIYGKHIFYYLA
jgi:hypothetical protein